jgi:hypothetical protein
MTIELTDDMRLRLADALTDGCPVVSASVDADGQPSLAFYGSTQVHSVDQLAIWVRDPKAGLLTRIAHNPRMAFLYRNQAFRAYWRFQGRARLVEDPAEAAGIYDQAPELERNLDPDRLGVAVVIDIDRVSGRDFVMER